MARRALCLLALLTGCQLVSGLQGERDLVFVTQGGEAGLASSGASGGVAPAAGGGGPTPSAPSSGGSPGGEGGAAGERYSGGASGESQGGMGQPEPPNDPESGFVLKTASCTGPALTGCLDDVDPCLTLAVPGGEFEMGRSEQPEVPDYFPTGPTSEIPSHSMTVSPFRLDKFEAVVGRFRRFVAAYEGVPPAAEAGANPHVIGSGWNPSWNGKLPANRDALLAMLADASDGQVTWSEEPGSGECRPVNGIDWYVAFAFCVWDGGRLPSEAEWEFAAAGGNQERLFPWGSSLPEGRVVYACSFSGSSSCTPGDVPPVGSFAEPGRGRYGHADLSGSVGELLRDVYDEDFYARPLAQLADAINLNYDELNFTAVSRGGAYFSAGHALRAVSRANWQRREGKEIAGVRCARSP